MPPEINRTGRKHSSTVLTVQKSVSALPTFSSIELYSAQLSWKFSRKAEAKLYNISQMCCSERNKRNKRNNKKSGGRYLLDMVSVDICLMMVLASETQLPKIVQIV